MEKYLTKFNTINEYNAFKNGPDIPYVNVSYIAENDSIEYYRNTISTTPFTIEIVSIPQDATCIGLFFRMSEYDLQSSKVKINNGEWQDIEQYRIDWDQENFFIQDLVADDKVQFILKCNYFKNFGLFKDNEWDNQNRDESNIDTAGNEVKIYGNILSLVCGDEYKLGVLPDEWHPDVMFSDDGNDYIRYILIDASDLWLPTNQLKEDCFKDLFKELYGLTVAPNIYAKSMPKWGCGNMFQNCRHLTSMPQIYIETIYDYSFASMFDGCTSLVQTTPFRIKSTKGEYSCSSMFYNCTALTGTPQWDSFDDLSIDKGSFYLMFDGCTSLTTINFNFGLINNTWGNAYSFMFQNCTSLIEVTIYA